MPKEDSWTRSDIRALQSSQADVLKWKFVAIGAVASAAFGLLPNQREGGMLVLAILPWLALYADALYRNYDLRIGTLTAFIRGYRRESWEYEMFLTNDRSAHKFAVIGILAVEVPTVLVCLVVAGTGYSSLSGNPKNVLVGSGGLCFLVSIMFAVFHGRIYGGLNGRAVELYHLGQRWTLPGGRILRRLRRARRRRPRRFQRAAHFDEQLVYTATTYRVHHTKK